MKKRLVLLSLFCAALAFFSACTEPGSSAGKQKFTLYVQGKVWKEISFEPGASVELPTPSPEGYTFFGWYEDPAFQVPFLERLTYDEGGTLYAMLVEDPAIGGLQGAESNMWQVCRTVRMRNNSADCIFIRISAALRAPGWLYACGCAGEKKNG